MSSESKETDDGETLENLLIECRRGKGMLFLISQAKGRGGFYTYVVCFLELLFTEGNFFYARR